MSKIDQILAHIGHLLPSQGPLEVFVHHNTLHAFEDLPFLDAVEQAGRMYGAQPYLSEQRYREEFRRGRITDQDFEEVLVEQGGDWINGDLSLREQLHAFIMSAPSLSSRSLIMWHLLERGGLDQPQKELSTAPFEGGVAGDHARLVALEPADRLEYINRFTYSPHFRSEDDDLVAHELRAEVRKNEPDSQRIALRVLWLTALNLTYALKLEETKSVETASYKVAARELVIPVLTKLVAAFLDEGLARWSLPGREKGFFQSATWYLSRHIRRWGPLTGIHKTAALFEGKDSREVIEALLVGQKIPTEQWEQELQEELLSLKGWAGFMHLVERRPAVGSLPEPSRHHALADLLAVKMLLEKHVQESIRKDNKESLSPASQDYDSLYEKALHLFRWCQTLGITAEHLSNFTEEKKESIVALFKDWPSLRRRRIWHLSYERNLERHAYSTILSKPLTTTSIARQKFQVICCIDDREESFRRHLEDLGPDISTFGTAGFFGVDVEFEEIGKEAEPYCPVVITPRHKVFERPRAGMTEALDRRQKRIESYRASKTLIDAGSRTAVFGWMVTLLGMLAVVPLALRTLFPRASHLIAALFPHHHPHSATEIIYCDDTEGDETTVTEGYPGFGLSEMVQRVEGLLRGIGLVTDFAPIIVLLGHGSTSRNNPFRSAYDCGACGGRPGRINARVFALMANRSDVRQELSARGIPVPASTLFIGGYHDTCNDSVIYFDTDVLTRPEYFKHQSLFEELRLDIDEARKRNARERCRRFGTARVKNRREALAHVEARSQDIAEPRPEYGHATNALCIIGRRSLTRGVFYDRRAFLVSYDPTIDHDGGILTSILSAVIPVCMGINLEYFFSSVDNETYGAGTKLPLNITALIGAITGYASDLRTGLPAQMVEIHEPVRLVTIIDTPLTRLESVLERLPYVHKVMKNGWVIPSAYDTDRRELFRMDDIGVFRRWESQTPLEKIYDSERWITSSSAPLPFVSLHRAF